jgi:hypothetical protein
MSVLIVVATRIITLHCGEAAAVPPNCLYGLEGLINKHRGLLDQNSKDYIIKNTEVTILS